MADKHLYLVLDCETATMPFINEITEDAEARKKIAIARPLIYDIGWVIVDRMGNEILREQYLVAETFSVPTIFTTAYYKEKRPIYLRMLHNGETSIVSWLYVRERLIQAMKSVCAVGAFNSAFDFKKAIPFTDTYTEKLYSEDYYEWEEGQKEFCRIIISEPFDKSRREKIMEPEVFRFHDAVYPLFDLWGLSTTLLINNDRYKRYCVENKLFSPSGIYFKTSAETTFQYIANMYDFEEQHTALDDAIIEARILSKITSRRALPLGIRIFPFRDLGYTGDFVIQRRTNQNHAETVLSVLSNMARENPENRAIASQLASLTTYYDQKYKKVEE